MKGINLMKTIKTLVPLCLCVNLFFALSCEQPFKAGLGPVVDVRPPTVRLDVPGAGSYIWGKRTFVGFAEDDYILDKVELMVTNYPDDRNPYRTYQLVNLTKKSPNKGDWELEIDTLYFTETFGDGDLKVRIRATDSAKKIAETDEIVFIVKNEPPAITLTAPYIAQGIADKDGVIPPNDAGGANLNYGVVNELPAMGIGFQRMMTQGNLISGTITFEEDIFTGAYDEASNRYPPQIRIWRVDSNGEAGSWLPGIRPPTGEVPWQNIAYNTGDPESDRLFALGVGNYQFIWDLPEAGYFYGFEIRAQSKDGRSPFHYPRDFYPNHEATIAQWEEENPSDDFIKENRYVLMYVNIQSEFPVVELLKLDDIFGPDGWDSSATPARYKDMPGVDDTQAHVFVNKDPISKNGAFTLRVKASHSEGIQSAEVYWIKEGTDERGRFIWDPADKSPEDENGVIINPNWNSVNNVETRHPYSHWGYQDPNIRQDNYFSTRNFIFTYNHNGADIIPDEAAYHQLVRGKSRIQVYNGDNWEERKTGDWPMKDADGNWLEEKDGVFKNGKFTEGLYTIEVYARSRSLASMSTPFTCSIRIDETSPTAEIVGVDGAYSQTPSSGTPASVIVNGVIETRLSFADSRPLDSGLRIAVEKYYQRGEGYGSEQRYILVKVADENGNQLGNDVQLEKLISGNYWPPTPASAGDTLDIPQVTVRKHGPIFESKFKIKTSKVYGAGVAENTGAEATLEDGKYKLYVFVRDNAFNVSHTTLDVDVLAWTDKPQFIFPDPGEGVISGVVEDPNINADHTTTGFWYGTLRDRLGSNTAIAVTITDDDSLDLGDPTAASNVQITFAGSKVFDTDGDSIGDTINVDPDKLITFDDATVKTVFTAQPADRRAIRERNGRITQAMLLQLMGTKNDEAVALGKSAPFGDLTDRTTIPDGIYRVTIDIFDYSPRKLTIGSDPAAVATNSKTFWIAADSINPRITDVEPDNGMIAPNNGLELAGIPDNPKDPFYAPVDENSSRHGIVLKGKVTDLNGPITVSGFTMVDNKEDSQGNPLPISGAYIYPAGTNFSDYEIPGNVNPATGLWEGNLAMPIRMNPKVSAVYNITLQLRDRFGRTSEVTRQYEYDVDPPTIELRRDMFSFSRALEDDNDMSIGGAFDGSDLEANKLVLTNGVVRFILNANDDQRVKEVRWWLLKHDTAFTGWNMPVASAVKSGTLDKNFNTPQYIDTTSLVDTTEYHLYAMARDAAGNVSDSGKDDILYSYTPGSVPPLQKVYVLQDQDRPYFGEISIGGKAIYPTPNGDDLVIVGENNMIIRGSIAEDDGFYNSDGTALRADSVQIQMTDDETGATGWSSWVTVGANDGVRMTGSRNISLQINLNTLADNAIKTVLNGDGQKWIKIKAEDSWYGKYINENGDTADDDILYKKSREMTYTFMLDKTAPVIDIINPAPAVRRIYGETAGTDGNAREFKVVGSISDKNLKKNTNGNYEITYQLSTSDTAETFELLPAYITSTDTTLDANLVSVPRVNFSIDGSIFTSAIGFDALPDGDDYSIMFRVEDLGGKTGSAPRSFTKDTTGPTFGFLNDFKKVDITSEVDWSGTVDYASIPRGDTLTVIQHDNSAAPSITGYFTDEYSNIDKTSFKVSFDGTTAFTVDTDQLEGNAKYVRWTVYLTTIDGKPSSTPADFLSDGMHTISLEIADDPDGVNPGNTSVYNELYGFRINSASPDATITPSAIKVYGDRSDLDGGTTVFTLAGTAMSRNLKEVQLAIQYTDTVTTPWTHTFTIAGADLVFTEGLDSRPKTDVKENYSWTLPVTKANILKAADVPDGTDPLLMEEGTYQVSVVAIDMKDKKSEVTTGNSWSFIIDRTSPTFSFINVQSRVTDNAPNGWVNATTTRPTVFNGTPTPSISMRVSDQNNLIAVELQLAKWDYTNSKWDIYNFNGSSPNWAAANTDWLPITLSTPTPEFIHDWDFKHADNSAITSLDDGYYRILLRAKDESSIAGGTTGWGEAMGGDATDDGNPAASPSSSSYAYFFIDSKPPDLDFNLLKTHYSSRYSTTGTDYGITFTVQAKDTNMFEKIVVSVDPLNTSGENLPDPDTISYPGTEWTGPDGSDKYTVNSTLAFTPYDLPNGLPDGAYRIVFEVTDLAGKTTRTPRTITLDNTSPTAEIEEPMLYPPVAGHIFASHGDIKIGGEPFKIKGTTGDLSANGSASGPAGIWYHIGYGKKETLPTEATSQAIMNWVLDADVEFVLEEDGSNDAFEAAAKKGTTGSLWFKYTPTPPTPAIGDYHVPTGFDDIASTEVKTWELNALNTVAAGYAIGNITINDWEYINGETADGSKPQYLARRIDESILPLNMRRSGLYSLPVVIRVVDKVGNVFYELRDIWLYPNGDNPSSTFINPSTRFTGYMGDFSPRGGQLLVEGQASDNVSVHHVIYRVKVDNKTFVNAGTQAAGNAPAGDGTIVTIPGAIKVDWDNDDVAIKWKTYGIDGDNVTEASGSGTLTQEGWYYADFEPPLREINMSWNFRLNAGDEITDRIASDGFKYPNTEANNNMIRVWIEVLVFDGETANNGSPLHLMSIGDDNDTASAPRPYVREFYFTKSAPSIDAKKISGLGNTTPSVDYTVQRAQDYVRSGKFAIQAQLKGNNFDIGQIFVRLRDDTDTDVKMWRPVYDKTTDTGKKVKTVNGATLSDLKDEHNGDLDIEDDDIDIRTATLTYTFDSLLEESVELYQAIREGDWINSGGTYKIDIRVADTNTPAAEDIYTFEVGIDNFAPLADAKTSTTMGQMVTPKKVAGTNADFLGRVFDYTGNLYPPHKAIKEVRVWFTNRAKTRYINIATGRPHDAEGNPNDASVAGATTATPGIWNKPAAAIVYNGNNVSSIELDDDTLVPDDSICIPTAANFVKVLDKNASGITWSPNNSNDWDIFWSFQTDTTKMDDGWMTMHYVVVDHADNRSYYTQEMIVMNKYPEITMVTLYTNNTGEGAVFTTHEGDEAYSNFDIPAKPFTDGYLDSQFISKNKVIGFGVSTIKGTPPLYYQARYVERYKVPLTKTNLEAMANKTGALTYVPDDAVWTNGVPDKTLSDSGFVNLYTIVDEQVEGVVVNDFWRSLGVHINKTPVAGMHFVFQPDEEMFSRTTTSGPWTISSGYDDAYVYAYRNVIDKPVVPRPDDPATTAVNEANTITPNLLSFNGDGDFVNATTNTSRIPEARAESSANAYYTASTDPDDIAAASAGNAFFLIKVWDNVDSDQTYGESGYNEDDMLYDAVVIGMRVYLTDGEKPTIRLYDLNPYTETEVAAGNNATDALLLDTINAAADPTAVGSAEGSNVRRGGLYNKGTNQNVAKSGYIEPRHETTALHPRISDPDPDKEGDHIWTSVEADGYYGGDANSPYPTPDSNTLADSYARDRVSGKVLLRGVAYDNQLINTISITIAPKTASGTNQPVNNKIILSMQTVTEDGKQVRKMLPPGYPNNTIQAWAAESIHWKTGHTVEWAYLWDTEVEPDTAGTPQDEVTITVSTKDKNGTGGGLSNDPVTLTQESTSLTNNTATPPALPDFTDDVYHNTIPVDIVPYVTGFERDVRSGATSLYATKRSRQGWYSFFRGETGIAVRGYNLGKSTSNALTMTITHGTGGNSTEQTENITSSNYHAALGHTFTMPNTTTIASGRINISVGGTDIYNHTSSHTNKSWNREYSENTDGSDLWINKPHAHVWRTTQDTSTQPYTMIGGTDSNASGPPQRSSQGMALQYKDTNTPLIGAWATYATAGYYYGTNRSASRTNLTHNANEPYSATDISIFNGTGTGNVMVTYQQDGQSSLRLNSSMATNNTEGSDSLVSTAAQNRPTQRWQNNRISKALNRAYMVSYDTYTKALWFNVNTSSERTIDGPTITGTTKITATGLTTDSTNAGEYSAVDYDNDGPIIAYYDQQQDTVRLAFGSSENRSTVRNVTNLSSANTGNTSNDFANNTRYFQTTNATNPNLAVGDLVSINNTYRYVVWTGTTTVNNQMRYRVKFSTSETDNTVWPANNNAAINTPTIGVIGYSYTWARCYLLPTSHALRGGSGQYISIKVDRRGGIHLAFYNSSYNTVVYAYASGRGALTDNANGTTPRTDLNYGTAGLYVCTVDNVVRGGQWTDISVDNRGNPMIVYGDSSRIGNYDGVRVAYYMHTQSASGDSNPGNHAQYALQFDTPLKCPITGATITGWEALSMPAGYKVNDDRLNVEVWPASNRNDGGTNEAPAGTLAASPGWSAAVGYGSDYFRVGYFFYPTWKGY